MEEVLQLLEHKAGVEAMAEELEAKASADVVEQIDAQV
jgi:hypothetical protein